MSALNTVNTHYPSYNVLEQMEQWDSHTKEIVRRRLGDFPPRAFLSGREARYLAIIARHIIYDNRDDIIAWVVHHFDEKLRSDIGENQRKVGTPPEKTLVRDGLNALDHLSRVMHRQDFGELDTQKQFDLLAGLQQGSASAIPEWSFIRQKELFNKLASGVVAAYYSHPTVWSEIGYGGPVYPNVYVRVELGLTDPWEAKRDGE